VTVPDRPSAPVRVLGPTLPAAGRFQRFRRWLRDAAPVPLLTAGNSGLCLFPLAGDAGPAVGGSGALVLFTGLAVSHRRTMELESLRAAVGAEAVRRAAAEDRMVDALDAGAETLQLLLRALAGELGLTAEQRISLYRREGDDLVRYARFCRNRRLIDGGRPRIPVGEGFLGRALESPKPLRYTVVGADRRAWELAQHSDHSLPLATAAALRMQVSSYLLLPVEDELSGTVEGVLVLESLRPGAFRLKDALQLFGLRRDLISRTLAVVGATTQRAAATGQGG
jgi:hypothetical protein